MQHNTTVNAVNILRPLLSLISKSEKTRQKVKPDTWQHRMLTNNLRALDIGVSLLNVQDIPQPFTDGELISALDAVNSMIERCKGVQVKFSPGSSQYTLQTNRINALSTVRHFISKAITNC